MDIRTSKKEASPTLAAIAGKLTKLTPLHAALAERAADEYRDHFQQRNAEPNKRGWPTQNFWAKIARSTRYGGADESAGRFIVGDERFNQKVYGGTITPGPGKQYLALPAIAEAAGHSPRDFDFLNFRPGRRGGALVEAERTLISIGKARKDGTRKVKNKGEGWGGRVWYWLVRSVTQSADEQSRPTQSVMDAALLQGADDYMARR